MIFKPSENYNVKNVFLQLWSNEAISYLEKPRPIDGLMLVVRGSLTFYFENEALEVKRGDMVYLPKNARYRVKMSAPNSEAVDYLINFYCNDTEITVPTRLFTGAGQKYTDIFNGIIDGVIKCNENDFSVKSQLYLLLDNVTKDMEHTKNEGFLSIARSMLEADNNYSMTEISKNCGVSVSGLRSIFKKSYGISPTQYRTNVRINKAKYLLQASDMSVEQIADSLGFFDSAYFCKIFKKNVGISPKGYIKNRSL